MQLFREDTMNQNLTIEAKQKPAVFAGILCILYPFIAAFCSYVYYTYLKLYGFSTIVAMPRVQAELFSFANLCFFALGILMFFKKPNWGHTIVLGIYTLYSVFYTLKGIVNVFSYDRLQLYVLLELLSTISIVFLLVLSILAKQTKAHPHGAKLWIAVLIIQVLRMFALIASYILTNPPALIRAFSSIFFVLITALVGKWLARYAAAGTYTAENTSATASTTATAAPTEDGYIDMVLHVLLMLFIGGIWQYIWIYKTTKALNRAPGFEDRNPTTKLLLCMFIPFYYLYWVYQSAQRIDALAKSKNLSGDSATLSLILAIFLGIVAPIFMQYKLNEICKAPAAAPAPTVAPAPAPVPVPTDDTADQIKKYKDLLDCGAITEEKKKKKKKQLLGL